MNYVLTLSRHSCINGTHIILSKRFLNIECEISTKDSLKLARKSVKQILDFGIFSRNLQFVLGVDVVEREKVEGRLPIIYLRSHAHGNFLFVCVGTECLFNRISVILRRYPHETS